MKVHKEEEKLSRLAAREDLWVMFYTIPWIERGKVFRFMKRQRWRVVLSQQGLEEFKGIVAVMNPYLGCVIPRGTSAFGFIRDQLLRGKTLAQIKEEVQ